MVLSKRRRDGEFIAWTPPSQAEPSNQANMTQQQPVVDEPPAKRTRVNPSRSTRYTTTTEGSPPPPKAASKAKKPRAPRGKKAAAAEPALPPPVATPYAGPSSSQLPPPPPAPARKVRKGKEKADPNAEPEGQPEKRQAQFKPRCPQNILDRVQRVMTQRCFLFMVHNFVRFIFSLLEFL